MKTIEIRPNVYLTADQHTIDIYLRECAEIAAKKRWEAQRARLVAWLATPEARNDPEYSDIFKDVYGFRPRW